MAVRWLVMAEAGLLSLQLAEIMDSIYVVASCTVFILGLGLWIHATYFRSK